MDERDSKDCTAFHRALARGDVTLVKFFISVCEPNDANNQSTIRPPKGESLLSLALSSSNEIVTELILPFATLAEVKDCWIWLHGLITGPHAQNDPVYTVLLNILRSKKGFKAPVSDTPPLEFSYPDFDQDSLSSLDNLPSTPSSDRPPPPKFQPNAPRGKFRPRHPPTSERSANPKVHTASSNAPPGAPAPAPKNSQSKPRKKRPPKTNRT